MGTAWGVIGLFVFAMVILLLKVVIAVRISDKWGQRLDEQTFEEEDYEPAAALLPGLGSGSMPPKGGSPGELVGRLKAQWCERGATVGPAVHQLAHSMEGVALLRAEVLHRSALQATVEMSAVDANKSAAVADSRDALGRFLRLQNKLKGAESQLRAALEVRTSVLGPDHEDTLNNLETLASVLWDIGKLDEAEACHRQAADGYRRLLCPEHMRLHPDMIGTLSNLAGLLYLKQDLQEAGELHRAVLSGMEEAAAMPRAEMPECLVRQDGVIFLVGVNHLANALRGSGRVQEAEHLCWRAFAWCKQVRRRLCMRPHVTVPMPPTKREEGYTRPFTLCLSRQC
eukprot:365199-Chlamydomonas_euryale.AAC.10